MADDKKRKRGKPIEKRLWWQQWDDGEAIRFCTGLNPYSSDYEKIIVTSADFTSGRVWPQAVSFASESGPKFIWEKFQRFLGVHEGAVAPSQQGPSRINVRKIQVPAPGKPTTEQKLNIFLNDPEKSIKIFMSSYAKSEGYIWSHANLDCIPRILQYFINFLLRSKVLPLIEPKLRSCLEVIALAQIEMPNMSNIAKTFPDKFSLACNACWGQKADGYKALATYGDEPKPEPEDDNTLEEPEAKRQKCDTGIPQPEAPVEPEKETPAETPAETTDTWGTGGGDWGAGAAGWGGNIAIAEDDSGWALLEADSDKPESLFSLLGPTVITLTHSPGIVERSMRQIVCITRPPPSVAKSPPLPEGIYEPSADAVELELDRRFAKVVLAPMIDWDGGESPVYTRPSILATSRGAVVVQDDNTPALATPVQGSSPQPPHNPESDEITVLIDDIASQIDYLRVGMAIGGTWVQLVRQGEPVVAKKKMKDKSKESSYWYLDDLALIVPSFWTIDG